MTDVLLAIGTMKGLFLARSTDRSGWELSELKFPMNAVYAVAIDTRRDDPRMFVSATSEHWGPSVFHSDDLGKSWVERPAISAQKNKDLVSGGHRAVPRARLADRAVTGRAGRRVGGQ